MPTPNFDLYGSQASADIAPQFAYRPSRDISQVLFNKTNISQEQTGSLIEVKKKITANFGGLIDLEGFNNSEINGSPTPPNKKQKDSEK